MQVRRDDQSRYHNLRPPSSLGSGWNEIHCPPALISHENFGTPKNHEETDKKIVEVLRLFRRATHTHCARASPPNATRRPSVLMMVCAVRLGTCNMRSRKERPSPHFLVSGIFAHDHMLHVSKRTAQTIMRTDGLRVALGGYAHAQCVCV